MVFRRRRLIPRRKRFRRRFFRRRSHRPIGSGPTAKRFFKLRYVADVLIDDNSSASYVITDNPNVAVDYSNVAGLFDYYRVCAIKIKFIPSANMNVFPAGNAGPKFAPVYVVHDVNTSALTVSTPATAIGYENMKVKNMVMPWSVYYKMSRNIVPTASANQSTRGYFSTSTPVASQSIQLLFMTVGTTSSGIIGTLVSTLYVVARNRL